MTPLPTALGDAEADLVQVIPPVTELQRSWRLADTRRTCATRRMLPRFFAFIDDEREALRSILTG